jgi:outer membrane receptor protein involved in Fe transport
MKKILLTVLIGLGFNATFAQFGPPGGGGGGGGMGRQGGGSENGRPTSNVQKSTTLDLEANVPKGNSKISGNVVDDALTTAVEFANIALINPETKKPVDGTMADEKGYFSMKKVAAGTYNIQISFIGFDNKIIEKVVVEKGKDIELGVIKLKQSAKQLDELVVSAEASLIEEKVDRLVYNAEKDLTSRGGDASDVLKNVPMLSVDLDGNVSLRGSGNIRVLINNKPSTIVASSVADALKMLPAELIKSVEVITSPSAKYDAEGSAGIINIITKKSTLQGLNLNIDTGVGIRGSNLGLNGNYRKGKLGISLGGFGRAFYNKSSGITEQNVIKSGINSIQTQEGNHFGMFGRYNVGLDYEIDKKQSLTGSFAVGTRRFDRDQLLFSNSYLNSNLLNSSIKDIFSTDNSTSLDANLDYIRTFKPGQEWSVSTQFSQNKLINNYNLDNLSVSEEILSRQKNINDNLNTEYTIQSDYVSPIGKTQQIEFGAKGVFRQVDSKYDYLFASPSGNFATDVRTPGGYLKYAQNVTAGYLSYLFTTKNKINIKVGSRYELTQITADDNTGSIIIPKYSSFVPSLNISKSIKASTYKIAYNRRIQRPGLQQLNPNVNLSNPLNISYGNANLKPELTNNLELSMSKSIRKTYLTFSVFGRLSDNPINRITSPSDTTDGGFLTTFQNSGFEETVGFNVFGNVILKSNWTLNGGIDTYYKYVEGPQIGLDGLTHTISNDGYSIGGRLMSNLKLKNGWALQGGGGMRGNQVNLQGSQRGMGMYSLGFRKDFGKKASLGLSGENFFGNMTMTNTTVSPTLTQKSKNIMYNSNVKVTFSYKIGNMKFVAEKKKVKNDDVKGGGDEN